MTTSLISVLSAGKTGMLTQLQAIEITGQNIANVQTSGFSRQSVVLEATSVGTGVEVASIKRSHDEFLFGQLVAENSNMGDLNLRRNVFDQVETLFNDGLNGGLNAGFSNFFGSLQDLANNPTGLAERAVVRGNAQFLTSTFNNISDQLLKKQVQLDNMVSGEVTEINSLVSQVAKLNKAIKERESAEGFQANDLRDNRDRLVNQLAGSVDINVVEGQSGINVTFSNGKALVLGASSFPLSTQLDGNNKGFKGILLGDGQGNTTDITSQIRQGRLRGILDMRDTEVSNLLDKLDRLAAGFIQEFNRVHSQGFGTDESTGVNFFAPLTPVVKLNINNAGSAQVAMSNMNPNQTSIDKFRMTFTSANTFSVANLTTGIASGTFTFTPGSTFNVGGLAVTISGTAAVGDRVDFSVSEQASSRIKVDDIILNNPQKITAGTTLGGDGENARRLADIQNKLVFDGVTIDAAGSGTFTFDDFYNSIVSQVGVNSRATQTSVIQQNAIMLQLSTRRESADGVSLDEEMINLIKFQQAFGAAARLINTINELMDVLVNRT